MPRLVQPSQRASRSQVVSGSGWTAFDQAKPPPSLDRIQDLFRDPRCGPDLTWSPDAHRVLTETAVSISEHKKNPMATVAAGEGMAVAVLNRNEPAFYCVPAKAYEELMDLVDDLELGRIADARLADGQEPVRVSLDAL
jgi:antitoxin StbD